MLVSAVVLAQAGGELRGWWIGIWIGVAVVLVVALVAVTLIVLAARIAGQADAASAALEQAEFNTRPLWQVAEINQRAMAVLEGTVRAREALEDRT
jgi:hypothetical protein